METLWLLLRHPMMGEGGSAAPRGVSPSVSSVREEVEPPMTLLSLVEGTWSSGNMISFLFGLFFFSSPSFLYFIISPFVHD